MRRDCFIHVNLAVFAEKTITFKAVRHEKLGFSLCLGSHERILPLLSLDSSFLGKTKKEVKNYCGSVFIIEKETKIH